MQKTAVFLILTLLSFFIIASGGAQEIENHPPVLISAFYFLGYVLQYPPVVITSDESAELGIYFMYADEDCNLAGGHFYNRMTEPEETDWEDLGILPEELGCSSEDEGLIYGFGFDEPLEPNEYAGETKWTDVLGAESNVMPWEFTVIAGDDDTDDDNVDDDIDDDAADDSDDDSSDDDGGDDGGGGSCGC